MSCSSGFRSCPSIGGAAMRAKGSDVSRMNSRNAAAIQDWTQSTSPRRSAGMPREATATAAAKVARISTQSSIEPSWFPQTPVIL